MNFWFVSVLLSSSLLTIVKGRQEIPVKKDVVVVGGGMAGMAAARHLLKDGRYDVKVLEARADRYGGRIWTNRHIKRGLKGVDVDIGGNFLNTFDKNDKLLKLVEEFELKMDNPGAIQVHMSGSNASKTIYYGANATELYRDTFKVLIDALKEEKQANIDQPLKDVLFEAIGLDSDSAEDLTAAQCIVKSLPVLSLQNFSALSYNIENEFGWDRFLIDGTDALLDRIVAGSGTELPIKIELKKVVRNIKIDPDRGKVLIRTKDRKQIVADKVVVALPIGVLKTESVIFEPTLSPDWYKAVRDIGIGYSSKVIVGFAEAFWPRDVGTFSVFSRLASDGFLQTWTNAYRISGNPILISYIFGDKAKWWESQPETKLKELVKQILGEMFGVENVNSHEMTTFLHSNWSTDEFAVGSVSYPRVGNKPDLWKVLQQPVCPYLYFAGAYTEAQTHVDSIQGAYNSGIKAAEQIIYNVCKKVAPKTTPKEKDSASPNKNKKKDEL